MKLVAANIKLDSIIENVEKDGVKAPNLVEDLKELREFALKEQDPLVTKVLRLSYEFITENGNFDVQAQFVEDEEENHCFQCNKSFNLFRWRHHCRSCG